jgi:hypothetical protein
MKRLILSVALALGLMLPALAQGAIPQPIYFWGSVAAIIEAPGQPPALEVIRPSAIALFADGSWDVDHLHWTGWGSIVAHATGISSKSNGIPNVAEGKRIKKPVRVTLSNPGRFQGHEVYRCFTLTVPSYPRSDQHLCLERAGNGWALGPTTRVTPGATAATTTAKAASFYSPSHNLSCEIDDGHAALVRVYCQSLNPPHSVQMGLDGQLKICSGASAATRCLGNAGEHTPILGYGKQVTVGRFRCRSEQAGVTCTVVRSGKGFLINTAGVTPVGKQATEGAAAAAVLHVRYFKSPTGNISCSLGDEEDADCRTWNPPQSVAMNQDGDAKICSGSRRCTGPCGPVNPPAACTADTSVVLAYGQRNEFANYRCVSATTGVTCTVIAGTGKGKGFLINSAGVKRVGP